MFIPITLGLVALFVLGTAAVLRHNRLAIAACTLAVMAGSLAIVTEARYRSCIDDLPRGFDFSTATAQAYDRGQASPRCERWPW